MDGNLPATAVPPSGSTFPIGTTTVDVTATDIAGNVGMNSFTVTVLSTVVTNGADSGAGSLRQALADAALLPGADTITLDASLAGQTITFGSEVVVSDADGVTIDASALAGGLTLSGGGVGRLFSVAGGSSLTLVEVTLTGGNGVGTASNGNGGAIYNAGTATLTRCTLSGNTAGTTFGGPEMGGAMFNASGGTLTLTHCTVAGNACISNRGGALRNNGTATFTHCTVSANTANFDSGGIRNEGPLTLENTIVAGNTVSSVNRDIFNGSGRVLTLVGANLVKHLGNDGTLAGSGTISTADPLLAALASNGGPTQTMALQAGSPAIDAAVGSTATMDQRGEAIVGTADLGAYEHPQAAQTITFTNPGGRTFGDAPFALSATGGGSGNAVTFAIVTGPATVLGDTLTITGAGDVTVRASQAGDETYSAAPDVDQTFTVAKAPQTITFPPLADRTFGDAPFAVNATSSSGETVGFLMIEGYAGIAMFDNGFAGGSAGQNVVINGAGHVTILASVPESDNYLAAPDVEQGFTIVPAGQAIAFNPPATATTADTIVLSATGGASGFPVVFSVESGPGLISGGNSLSFTGPGEVIVRASQAGDGNYTAAPPVDRTIAVSPSLTLADDKGYASKGVFYFDVLANDTSTSGAIFLESVTQPVGGNAKTKIEGGRVHFTAVSTVTAPLTFTYTASNGFDTNTATVTVRPFSAATGTYVGLMKRADDTVRGRVVFTATALGQMTGQMRYEGRAYVLKGGVNWTELAVTGPLPRPQPAVLGRGEDDVLGRPTFTLTVPDSIVGETLTGTFERSPYGPTSPAPQAGLYTIVAELPGGGTGPARAASFTCSIVSNGTVKFAGKTANGVAVTQGGKLLAGGRLPFFASTGLGAAMQGLGGEMVFDPSGTPDVTGTLRWKVPAGTLRLAAGVDQDYDVDGRTYAVATSAAGMFNPAAPTATLTLTIPSLGANSPVVRTLTLSGTAPRGTQKVFITAPGSGYITFNVKTGYFSGVFTLGGSRSLSGVVQQIVGESQGAGMILDAATLGEVTIVP